MSEAMMRDQFEACDAMIIDGDLIIKNNIAMYAYPKHPRMDITCSTSKPRCNGYSLKLDTAKADGDGFLVDTMQRTTVHITFINYVAVPRAQGLEFEKNKEMAA